MDKSHSEVEYALILELAGLDDGAREKFVYMMEIRSQASEAMHSAELYNTHAQVYSDPTNVDDDLVESIVQPAASSANAPEVFRRIITGNGTSINRLLRKTRAPLLLLWGDKVKAPPCDESNCHAHVVLCMTPENCRDLCTMLAYNMMVAVALYNHLDSRERKLED